MKELQTIDQFQEVISGEQPVIVKFYTTWCPDCVRMDMFIADIVNEYSQYDWFQINRDHVPELAEKYQVMGIPSLLVFQKGEKTAHLHSANAKTPEEVKEFLRSVFSK
ncbi:thioredoxin family protein [Anoxybacillus sp. B7M1]|uniref:Thioredoxin family protein n=1 Tax=Anoxybacteroides rupiense TaxID=311460 RepID=A0ABD5IVL5_9BACL|nr:MULTISPECIES: thioredoxin family protein [Anoxybacillus]KXG10215.1 Thioredoxin-like protein YdbP [Anoxybacillus sp. P3H1B]OQM46651.1 thiol reductase thioredoxin [Anoxybacillus sp. UARK-01]QHC03295.1 thiol reductase thioredoxin [Anoxybacillus sp. PDR2]ANB57276.1 thioredoxin family protein [Anoxybacillus sp. B2M1]ANB64088.1 thioredoxin family protein [Anoxybacillus sp. B7M1]